MTSCSNELIILIHAFLAWNFSIDIIHISEIITDIIHMNKSVWVSLPAFKRTLGS